MLKKYKPTGIGGWGHLGLGAPVRIATCPASKWPRNVGFPGLCRPAPAVLPKAQKESTGYPFSRDNVVVSIVMGGTQNGWFIRFIRENPIQVDDLRVPPSMETLI